MSLHEDFNDMIELARTVISDKKEEKQRAERERRTIQLVCPYCSTSSRFVWEDGKLPDCPNCGAAFAADDPQLVKIREKFSLKQESERRAHEEAAVASAKMKRKIRFFVTIGVLVIILLIAAAIIAKMNGGALNFGGDATFNFHVDVG